MRSSLAHRQCGTSGPGNLSFTLANGDERATAAAFAGASHVVSLRIENNRLAPNAMEPRVSVGDYDPADGGFTLYTSSQAPHAVRMQIATHVFGLPEKLHVIDVATASRNETRVFDAAHRLANAVGLNAEPLVRLLL